VAVAGGGEVEASSPSAASGVLAALAWLVVLVPIGWGVWLTVTKAAALFR